MSITTQQNGLQSTNRRLILAQVVVSLPEMGFAVVDTVQMPTRTFIAYFPYGDHTNGAGLFLSCVKGCIVTVSVSTSPIFKTGFITGVLNTVDDPLTQGANGLRTYLSDTHYPAGESVMSAIKVAELYAKKDIQWANNRMHSASPDMYPGDIDIRDKAGVAGLHVGMSMASLYGSPLAFVDASGTLNKVRVAGATVELHTTVSEQVSTSDYVVRNTAISASEAVGAVGESGFVQDAQNETFNLSSAAGLPLFRIQHVEGAVADGVEDIIVSLNRSDDQKVSSHTLSTAPYVLARRRSSLSGELSSTSTQGIYSMKAPGIDAVLQAGYQRAGKNPEADNAQNDPESPAVVDDLRQKWEPTDSEDFTPNLSKERKELDEDDKITDAALLKLAGMLTSGDYCDKLVKKMARLGFGPARFSVEIDANTRPNYPDGDAAQQFPLPSSVVLTDPVTGESKRYYDSLSFITQEPDGSICICDGYGSEIRMCRGNIYISPALDLFLRPGRDLSVMAGRHQSYNSQRSCTIHSSDSVHIRAEHDLKLSGTSENTGGVVSIECLSKNSTLHINSHGCLSLATSRDLYIGRNSFSSSQPNTTTSPEYSGSIIIDAGHNGSIYSKSLGYTVEAYDLLLGSFGNAAADNGVGVLIQRGRVSIFSPTVSIPGDILMQNVGDSPVVKLFRNGQVESVTMSAKNNASIIVPGSIVVGENLLANGGGRFNQGLQARGIQSTAALNTVVPPKDTARVFKNYEMPDSSFSDTGGNFAGQLLKSASATVYQDASVSSGAFYYPDYSDVVLSCVPGMVWQQFVKDGSQVWHEPELMVPEGKETMCYPGAFKWKSASISAYGIDGYSKSAQLSSGYKINSKPRS